MIQVTLPWPPAALNPNAAKRLHWGKRAALAKRYKRDCGWACVAAGARPLATSRPLLASIKAGLDAVSNALGVDDSLFDITLKRGDPIVGGAVVVCITDTVPAALATV